MITTMSLDCVNNAMIMRSGSISVSVMNYHISVWQIRKHQHVRGQKPIARATYIKVCFCLNIITVKNKHGHHTLHSYEGPHTMSCAVQPSIYFSSLSFHVPKKKILRYIQGGPENILHFQNDTENMCSTYRTSHLQDRFSKFCFR